MIIDLNTQNAGQILAVLNAHGLRIKAGAFVSGTAPAFFEINDSKAKLMADLVNLLDFLNA